MMTKMSLIEPVRRRRAEERFQELMAEAKRQGAAMGRLEVERDFSAWAEAMVRPVVYLEYGRPGAAPERLRERRDMLCGELKSRAADAPAERVTVAVSYPLTTVVLLAGAVTGLALHVSGPGLAASQWALVGLASLWLTAALHGLPVGLRLFSGVVRTVSSAWRRRSLQSRIERLEEEAYRERARSEQRQRSLTERVDQLVRVYEFYRIASPAVPVVERPAA